MIKLRTLREGFNESFANDEGYTRFGEFLRKTKLDELPAVLNVLKGDMHIFGYRPEEKKTIDILPEHMKEVLLSTKPGLVDLSSLHFFDEERILNLIDDPHEVYWKKIRPIKYTLQVFYIKNKCFFLDLAIFWIAIKKMIKSVFK